MINNLVNVEVNGVLVKGVSTRLVADMAEVAHANILKKLDGTDKIVGIIPTLTKVNFNVSEYFIKSTYVDGSGKTNKEYICTKKGCELLANKFTGEKGIIFTAKYVEMFNEMEQEIKEIKSVVDAKGCVTDEEFYEIHFATPQRVRKAFTNTGEYFNTFTKFMEYANTLDAEVRIKKFEHLQKVLEENFNTTRQDLSVPYDKVNNLFGMTKEMQLALEENINEIKNRQYGQKLRNAKKVALI